MGPGKGWRWRPDVGLPSDQLPGTPRPTYRSEHALRLPHGSAAPEEAHGHHQGPCTDQHVEPCGEEGGGDAERWLQQALPRKARPPLLRVRTAGPRAVSNTAGDTSGGLAEPSLT